MACDDSDWRMPVVVNDEEQYSIRPVRKPIPADWQAEGMKGNNGDCLAHIERVWTDMRPLSLRKALDVVQ